MPAILRGPMVTSALQQMLFQSAWGELDYLIIDLPPGTGDIQLTLAQKIPVSGAVVVTTPQDLALIDARKGVEMFKKVNVPVLGIVENMSTHICSKCGHEEHIFGEHGGQRLADEYDVDLLGELPLDISIREYADAGQTDGGSRPRIPDRRGLFRYRRATPPQDWRARRRTTQASSRTSRSRVLRPS